MITKIVEVLIYSIMVGIIMSLLDTFAQKKFKVMGPSFKTGLIMYSVLFLIFISFSVKWN